MSNTTVITKQIRVPEFEVEFGFTNPVTNEPSAWVRHSSGEAMQVDARRVRKVLLRMEQLQERHRSAAFEAWYLKNF